MKERNELLEIWHWLRYVGIETKYDKDIIINFWTLKQKLDDLKKQVDVLLFLSQPTPITDEEIKRIIREYE